MPYKFPGDKRDWDAIHRPDRSKEFLRTATPANAWAESQIKALKALGVRHSREEWLQLRSALRAQFRVSAIDRSPPTP